MRHACIYIYTYIYDCGCTQTCRSTSHAYTRTSLHMYAHRCMHTYIHGHLYKVKRYTHIHIHTYKYTYIHTYIRTYTHIQTAIRWCPLPYAWYHLQRVVVVECEHLQSHLPVTTGEEAMELDSGAGERRPIQLRTLASRAMQHWKSSQKPETPRKVEQVVRQSLSRVCDTCRNSTADET